MSTPTALSTMTAQIIDLDAEISALLHDVQSADPDAGP